MSDRSTSLSHPAEWLVVLRIAVGLYFVKTLVTKMSVLLAGGVLPVPVVSDRWLATMPKIVAKQASENPIAFYKHFLEQTVLTHADLFAHLTAWGETVAGLGLWHQLPVALAVEGAIVVGGLIAFVAGSHLPRGRSIGLAAVSLLCLAFTVVGMTSAPAPPSAEAMASSSLITLAIVCTVAVLLGRPSPTS